MKTAIPETPRVHVTPSAADKWRLYEKEIATYLRELPRLIGEGNEGCYVLIKGDEVLGVWKDQADAMMEGHRRFGANPICVKKIDSRDPERFSHVRQSIP